jgi:hypothetical protein
MLASPDLSPETLAYPATIREMPPGLHFSAVAEGSRGRLDCDVERDEPSRCIFFNAAGSN